ncbi:MAG TPA: hypothetical protein DCL35_00855 [Candidatus Omnitrophica bacterium]|nr:hypothetical protein [Candidatus Omnitrophota bacterium]
MEEVYFFRIFNLVVGVIGLAIGIGVILIPKAISNIENKLDKNFSTDMLEKMLNQRRNLSQALLKHPKIFGAILLVISFLLLLSSVYLF